jgi:fumarate hydratase class II
MNVYKPVVIANVMQSLRILADGCRNFRVFLIEGTEPNRKQIDRFLERSLMLVTALSPVIGYDNASRIAHHANDHDMTLRDAALALGLVGAEEFDRIVDPLKMVRPFVAAEREEGARS